MDCIVSIYIGLIYLKGLQHGLYCIYIYWINLLERITAWIVLYLYIRLTYLKGLQHGLYCIYIY